MPQLTQAKIRNNAVSFVHEWKDESPLTVIEEKETRKAKRQKKS